MKGLHKVFFVEDEVEFEKDAPIDVAEISEQLVNRGGFHCHATLKAADEDARIVEGYANTKSLDRVREIVDPNAFRGTLREWMKNPVILADHWPSVTSVIGKGIEAKVDDIGLRLKAQIAKGTQLADDTWALIQQNMVRAFSIGFRILKSEMVDDPRFPGKDDAPKVRKITKLELYEVSVVAIPANRESLFSVAKGIQYGTDLMAPADGVLITPSVEATQTEGESETAKVLREINNDLTMDLVSNEISSWRKELKNV